MTAGIREPVAARCLSRSRPFIPPIRRSSTRQPVFSCWLELKKSSADANVSTRKPTEVRRFLRDRRSDWSSSTTETTGPLPLPMRPRQSVNENRPPICYQPSVLGGKRLPYLGGVGAFELIA